MRWGWGYRYGFAKDFGVAGWRVGVLHTLNKPLLSAVGALAHTAEASTLTLNVLAEIIRGPATAKYLAEHRDRLASAYFGLTHQDVFAKNEEKTRLQQRPPSTNQRTGAILMDSAGHMR